MVKHDFYLSKGENNMSIEDLLEDMIKTLNKLYMCKSSTKGLVNYDIENAILYFKKMLINNGCILSRDTSNTCLDDITLYNTLLSICDEVQWYNSIFSDDYLVGVWWNVCLAMNDLEIDNVHVENYVKERVRNNK